MYMTLRRATVALVPLVAALLLLSAGSHPPEGPSAPVAPSAHASSIPDAHIASRAGRSQCPGALAAVRLVNEGQSAEVLERIQNANEGLPGFLAVVNDGAGPVIVVERGLLADWTARVAGTEVRVAPSCVAPEILAKTTDVVAQARLSPGEVSSSGYDAIHDAMVVSSTYANADMLALLTRQIASAGDAYADGTLRLVEIAKGSYSRQ